MNPTLMVTMPSPAGMEPPFRPERRRETLRLRRDEVRRRMRMLGLTHAELARRAQVAKGTVARALAGGSIQAGTMRAIARALAEAEPIPGLDGLIDLGDSDAPGTEAAS
jgi:transcriptional regulator with XRE-family HTH domain